MSTPRQGRPIIFGEVLFDFFLADGNRVLGGAVVRIPGESDRFNLQVSPPFGEERIIVYASSAPMGDVDIENINDTVYGLSGDLNTFSQKTRGVRIVPEAGQSNAEFYEASCVVTTKPD